MRAHQHRRDCRHCPSTNRMRCCELSSSCPSLTKNSCIFCWFSYARISRTRSTLSLTHTNTHPHVPHTIVCGGCLEPRVGGIVCVLLCVSGAVLVRYDNHAHEGAQTCLVILCATGHCVNTIYFSAGLRDVHRILISMCVVAQSRARGYLGENNYEAEWNTFSVRRGVILHQVLLYIRGSRVAINVKN